MVIHATLDSALFWLMVHLSPSFFVQWTLLKMTGNPALNLVRSPPKIFNFTKVWAVFICTCLSVCQKCTLASALPLCCDVRSCPARATYPPVLWWWICPYNNWFQVNLSFFFFITFTNEALWQQSLPHQKFGLLSPPPLLFLSDNVKLHVRWLANKMEPKWFETWMGFVNSFNQVVT